VRASEHMRACAWTRGLYSISLAVHIIIPFLHDRSFRLLLFLLVSGVHRRCVACGPPELYFCSSWLIGLLILLVLLVVLDVIVVSEVRASSTRSTSSTGRTSSTGSTSRTSSPTADA
jgi:hypothetical protein